MSINFFCPNCCILIITTKKKKSIFFKFQEWGSISNPAILWIFEISLPKKRKKLFHGWMNWKRKMIQNEIFSNSTWWVEVDRSQLGKHIWSNPLFFFKCQSSLVLWKEAIANVRKSRKGCCFFNHWN